MEDNVEIITEVDDIMEEIIEWAKEMLNSTSKFWSILVYIVGIIVNVYWGFEAFPYLFGSLFGIYYNDFYVPISVSFIFSFLALRNYRNLKRLKFTIFVISASILHYFLSLIFWFFSTPWPMG